MADYPNTGTQLQNSNGTNKTSVGLSTHILIKNENGDKIGAIKSLSVTEQGTVTQITELGTDGVIDSCRTQSVKISGDCSRTRFSKARITEAFGREYVHLQSQAYPFDIWIIDRKGADISEWVTTVIKNVWINNIQYTYSDDNWVLVDKMSWQAETIYSTLGANGNIPSATGGLLGIKLANYSLKSSSQNLNAEQAADVGLSGRRGSLDVPGLIDAIIL